MAIHASVCAWRIPVDRGAWWAAVHGAAESVRAEHEHTHAEERHGRQLGSCVLRHPVLVLAHDVGACAVTQSSLTLWPRDHSPPGSSVHGILQARTLECWSGLPFPLQGIFRTQGSNLHILHVLH